MIGLDRQVERFKSRLIDDVHLTSEEASKVSTLCAADVRFLPGEVKAEIAAASEVPVSARYQELLAFQAWSDIVQRSERPPPVVRAQVVVQNYICFLYLKDACFEVLAQRAAENSVVGRCSKYLCRGEVRDFRNAFAHANWMYRSDFSGFSCWVNRDGRNPKAGRRTFEVMQNDVDFWQTLSRAVAYAAFEQIKDY